MIFDHDHALLGCDFEGIDRLIKFREELGLKILGDSSDVHPFLKIVNEKSLFDDWFNRIYSIPNWFIQEICFEACNYDLNKTQAKKLIDFLCYRKSNLEQIVQLRIDKFTGLADKEQNEGLF